MEREPRIVVAPLAKTGKVQRWIAYDDNKPAHGVVVAGSADKALPAWKAKYDR